jgi:uncharacterized protein (DUF169 family)
LAAQFLTGEIVYSLGDHGTGNYMKIKDEEIFIGIPAELLPFINENPGKLFFKLKLKNV